MAKRSLLSRWPSYFCIYP